MNESSDILGLVGSYRKGGTIDTVITRVLDAAARAGVATDKIYLCDVDINFCTNCRECMQPPGEKRVPCVVHDDEMEPLLERIERARALVVGAPVNAGSVNAVTQRFIERCVGFFFWPWGTHGGPRIRHRGKSKKAVLVSSSGAPALLNTTWFGVGALHSLKTFAEVVGADVEDVVKVGMVTEREMRLSESTLRACDKAGKRLAAAVAAMPPSG